MNMKDFWDGSAAKQGSGVGVLLISPQWDEIWALSSSILSNEALLVGQRVAKHIGALKVILHSDSQFVAQQLEGAYDIKNDWLHRFTEIYEKIEAEFIEIVL